MEIGRADARGEPMEDALGTEALRRTLLMDEELVEVPGRAHRCQAGGSWLRGTCLRPGHGGYVGCDEAGNVRDLKSQVTGNANLCAIRDSNPELAD